MLNRLHEHLRPIIAGATALALNGCCLNCHRYDQDGVAVNRQAEPHFFVEVDAPTYQRMGCTSVENCPPLVKLMNEKVVAAKACAGQYALDRPSVGRGYVYAKGQCRS